MVTLKTIETRKTYEIYLPHPKQPLFIGTLVRLHNREWVAVNPFGRTALVKGPRRDAIRLLVEAVPTGRLGRLRRQ